MSDKEKIIFFDQNIKEIFSHQSNYLVDFISSVDDMNDLTEILTKWPDNLKIIVVTDYINYSK